jgi:hypothetical protein
VFSGVEYAYSGGPSILCPLKAKNHPSL